MALPFPNRVRDKVFTIEKPEAKKGQEGVPGTVIWHYMGHYCTCKLSKGDNYFCIITPEYWWHCCFWCIDPQLWWKVP